MDQEEPREVRRFRKFLLSDESIRFRQALTGLHLSWDLATVTAQLPELNDHAEAARLIGDTLHEHLEAGSQRDWVGPIGWVGPEQAASIDALAYRGRAAELMALGGFLIAAGVTDPDRFAADLFRVGFGVDPYSTLLGDVLGNHPLDIDLPELPPELAGIRDFLDGTCVAGIVGSASQYGHATAARPRSMPGATITGVDRDHGCAGDSVVIRGAGFGQTQPSNVEVLFTSHSGGCVSAEVASWSDNEITVIVPPFVGRGCVALSEYPSGSTGITEAADQFAGELEACLGPIAGKAADRIRGSAAKVMDAACPICADPSTQFAGGVPAIKSFTANGGEVAEITPGGDVTLRWQVEGADRVLITAVLAVLPQPPGPFDPRSGTAKVAGLALADGTVGTWRLVATNACGTVTASVDVVSRGTKAVVFGVGGAKGAFEVGAARCLFDVAGIRPKIFSGASVGALNAAKLAEGGPALSELEQLWLSMQSNSDLYLERQWFQVLEPPLRSLFRGASSGLGLEGLQIAGNMAANRILGALVEAMGIPGLVFSIFTGLYPVLTGIIDLIKYNNAVAQALASDSIFLSTPVQQKINANIDPWKITAAGNKLRITAVALESGKARVFREDGVMLGTGIQSPTKNVILASASIPVAFPPVPLLGPDGWEWYIDGGVRESAPLQAAVEAGAHRIYTILANPISVERATAYYPTTMIKIAGRTVDIFLDEAQRNDIFPYRGFGVPITAIAPSFLVHDTLLVDPGLISINMDYGYMRAYDDVVADPTERGTMRQLSDQITTARVSAWSHEHWANGERLPGMVRGQTVLVPDPVELQAARNVKKAIRALVYNRIVGHAKSVPTNPARWWREWERHPWRPLNPSPWDQLISRLGILPAEPAPPA
jgi:NTE family protein